MTKTKHKPEISSASGFAQEAERTARAERQIQAHIDETDEGAGGKKEPQAMQAGARNYPVPPLPGQHFRKPGREADLDLSPMYNAPHYKGSEKLKNMVAGVRLVRQEMGTSR